MLSQTGGRVPEQLRRGRGQGSGLPFLLVPRLCLETRCREALPRTRVAAGNVNCSAWARCGRQSLPPRRSQAEPGNEKPGLSSQGSNCTSPPQRVQCEPSAHYCCCPPWRGLMRTAAWLLVAACLLAAPAAVPAADLPPMKFNEVKEVAP